MVWQLRTRRDIAAVDLPPEEQGFPALRSVPHPAIAVLGRRVPTTAGCKNQQELDDWDGGLLKTEVLQVLKGLCINSGSLSSSKWTAAWKAPGAYGEMNWPASEWGLEGQRAEQHYLGEKCWQAPLFLWWVAPAAQLFRHLQAPNLSCPLTWLTHFAPPRWFPKALHHATGQPILGLHQQLLQTTGCLGSC